MLNYVTEIIPVLDTTQIGKVDENYTIETVQDPLGYNVAPSI